MLAEFTLIDYDCEMAQGRWSAPSTVMAQVTERLLGRFCAT